MTTKEILVRAKSCAPRAALLSTQKKNEALLAMADALVAATEDILSANQLDVQAAQGIIAPVMLDRLSLNESRIRAMAEGIRQVAELPDPVGRVRQRTAHKKGMVIQKVGVPMGVVAIIYESRPNVTSDAAALAIKSGNACVLRGGKEAFRSANAIVKAMQQGLMKVVLCQSPRARCSARQHRVWTRTDGAKHEGQMPCTARRCRIRNCFCSLLPHSSKNPRL